jgi:uncharacterized membrane-anchored protein
VKSWHTWTAIGLLLLGAASPATAQSEEATRKAFDDARQAARRGPQDIELASQAVLHLPAGHLFVPQPQATPLLNVMGNPGRDDRLQGVIFPDGGDAWFVTIRYEASGYVKDDDARDWNADELLKSYRDGTEQTNEERVKLGVPALEIVGWAEKPAYDPATHRLAWAMSSREKGSPSSEPQGVNYNTYALGREGYFSLNLVTELKGLAAYKGTAHALLGGLEYKDGKRYSDFSASTDRVAEYGLAALVVGVGAKKLGLFAVAAAFLAKFAKVIILAGAAFGAAFLRFFRRKTPPTT